MAKYRYLESYKDVIVSKLIVVAIIDSLLVIPTIAYGYRPHFLLIVSFVIVNVWVVWTTFSKNKEVVVSANSIKVVSKSKSQTILFENIEKLRFYYTTSVNEEGAIRRGVNICEITLQSGKLIEITEDELEDFDEFKLELSNLFKHKE